MALTPYSSINNPVPSKIRPQINGIFAINDTAPNFYFEIFLFVFFLITNLDMILFFIKGLIIQFDFTISIILLFVALIWNGISYIVYLIIKKESIMQLKTLFKTENARLLLKSSIIKRGDITELSFSRELRWNKSLPMMGTLYWRASCTEVTRTGNGTGTSYSHNTLWTEELSPTSLSAGVNAIQGQNWVVLPNHLPATLPAGSNNDQNYTESWIEWQVQISSQITDFDLNDSRFVLTVQ